ncbi:hypothetical protein GCM10022236_52980 [Microlunatus ginsengisoli]|uniref:Uncharacterized protein n=1 Tax=Microlunatus ginsengisoli TaxID=363863 RepID=A0ABP7AZN9_9ACTN
MNPDVPPQCHPKESVLGGFQNLAECVGLGAMDALRVDAKQHDDAVSGPFCDLHGVVGGSEPVDTAACRRL